MTQDERINAISVNPHMATIDDIADLAATVQEQRERIAELEAANQWHSASEPPEAEGDEYEAIRICNGKMYRRYSTFRDGKWNFVHRTISPVIFWRDLPPMPGKE